MAQSEPVEKYRKFAIYNIAGGVLWVLSTVLLGYALGRTVPDLEKHIHLVIAGVILLSILPGVIEYLRARRGGEASR